MSPTRSTNRWINWGYSNRRDRLIGSSGSGYGRNRTVSSNELNLNTYWFQQAEYLRGDMIRCAQDGRYVDAARSLLYLLEQLPPEEEDPEIKGWIVALRGIRARAQADAEGSTRTLRKYDEDNLRNQHSREAYEIRRAS